MCGEEDGLPDPLGEVEKDKEVEAELGDTPWGETRDDGEEAG